MTGTSFSIKPALLLVAIGAVAAVLLAGLDQLTRQRIALEQDRRALAQLEALLPDIGYDNELVRDWVETDIPPFPEPARIYRARRDGEPAALIIDLVTPRGYSGSIRLLVATTPGAEVLGVRVLEHRETPGLGDRIERRRSDWIEQFTGRRLGQPEHEQWLPDRRGGAFDTLTSATITSSAVIHAVLRALETIVASDDELWTRPSESGDDSPDELESETS